MRGSSHGLWLAFVVLSSSITIASCGGVTDERCGPGTVDSRGECVVASSDAGLHCGAGTVQRGDTCFPSTTVVDAGVAPPDDATDAGDTGGIITLPNGTTLDVNTACLTTDNSFAFGAGPTWIDQGGSVFFEGGVGWGANVEYTIDGLPSYVDISAGQNWHATFTTNSMGVPLLPGDYANAEDAYITDPSFPGISVNGNGAACDRTSGEFKVLEMTANPDAGYRNIESITVVFKQYCDQYPNPNYGCLHITQ